MPVDILDYTGIWSTTDSGSVPIVPLVVQDLTLPVQAGAEYAFILFDPLGTTQLAVLDNYESAEYVLVENDVGVLTIVLPSSAYDPNLFAVDNQIIILRRAAGGSTFYIEDNAIWFLRKIVFSDNNEAQRITLTANHCISILDRRVIPYAEGNAYTLKLDAADDVIKAIVRENLGSLATDTTRDLTSVGFVVQEDTAGGPVLKAELSNQTVLEALQNIADAAFKLGTWVGFNIVINNPITHAMTFETYITTSDTDRRLSSGNPLLIGPDFGNLVDWEYSIDWIEEINFVYAGGPNFDFVRPVATSQDTARVTAAPYARVEEFVDASSSPDADSIQAAADAEVIAKRPVQNLSGTLTDNPQARYGIDWRKGTLVTGQALGIAVDYRICQVHVTLSGGQETIDVELRSYD